MDKIKELDNRVNKGIKFLDEEIGRKEWTKKIDLEELDLSDPNVCVLGEIYGDYDDGLSQLNITDDQANDLGFYIKKRTFKKSYRLLTSLWIIALTKLGIK